jgi:hypothetical protein
MKVSAQERIVCAILAAQVASLGAKMDAMPAFDLLWRTTALLSWLSGLLTDMGQAQGVHNPVLERERAEATAEIAQIRHGLDELAFLQAQRHDFARQIAECVVAALNRMAGDGKFSSGDLAALYVSADQRKLHDDVIRRLSAEAEAAE